jgi:oligopeptide/dipeptide ABC transporter ATP-binding protein
MELLRDIQKKTGMAILLITHDLGVVAENADAVAVMYASRIVEFAPVEQLYDDPRHPYTRGLFRSVPKLGQRGRRLETIAGSVPNPSHFPSGCKFHPRCPLTRELAKADRDHSIERGGERLMRICVEQEPQLRQLGQGHWGACHFAQGYEAGQATRPQGDFRRGGR